MSKAASKIIEKPKSAGPATVFINARLLDPASSRDEPGGLLVKDGIIADLGSHLPDRFQRRGGPQRDLYRRQAAARQRAGQRHGVSHIGDLENGDDRLAIEERQEFLGLAGHSLFSRRD